MRIFPLILAIEFMFLVAAFFWRSAPEDVPEGGIHLDIVDIAQSRGDIVFVEPRSAWECSLTRRFRAQYARSRLEPCIAERYAEHGSNVNDEAAYFGQGLIRYDTDCALEVLDLLKTDGDIAYIEPGYH